jgi:Glutamine amidotransferases class-II
LDSLKAEFKELPTLPVLHRFIKKICDEVVSGNNDDTIFNFLLGCGLYTMFAYSWPGRRPNSKVWNGLWYIVRQPPFRVANLIDCDYSIDFSRVTTKEDRVAVIATKPLTNELEWKEFKRGELIMFDHGVPYSDPDLCFAVEKQGRGLQSKVFPKSPLLGSNKIEISPIPTLSL